MWTTEVEVGLGATDPVPPAKPKTVAEITPTIKMIQQALKLAGFDPGPIDGISGRKTEKAMRDFRLAVGLVNPAAATISLFDPEVMGVLFKGMVPPAPPHDAPWLDTGWSKLLLHEKINNNSLWDWLRIGGKSVGDPAKIPWCGDFVETCIALALPHEALPTNPFLARNWLNFGQEISEPSPGAIAVFYRGDPKGWSGHVGFYVSEEKNYYHILGGNQGNRVSVSKLAKSRLLGFRWPMSYVFSGPNIVEAERGGGVSTDEA